METIWWTITVLLMAVGLAGTILPVVPGVILILAGAVLNVFTVGAVGWWTVAVLVLLAAGALAIDVVSGMVGARYFGASRWGALGGLAGAIVGLFFGLPGLLLGPLIGAIAAEILSGRKLWPATGAGWGTLVGTTAGMIGKFVIGLAMITWFTVAALT